MLRHCQRRIVAGDLRDPAQVNRIGSNCGRRLAAPNRSKSAAGVQIAADIPQTTSDERLKIVAVVARLRPSVELVSDDGPIFILSRAGIRQEMRQRVAKRVVAVSMVRSRRMAEHAGVHERIKTFPATQLALLA